MLDKKVAILTGCSSGFGYCTALALAGKGWHVCATIRNLKDKDKLVEEAGNEKADVVVKQLDVRDEASINRAVDELLSETGRIDLLVNNAGYGLIGALEDIDMSQMRDQFETNFFGCVRMIQKVMPVFRNQKRGHIVNVTSAAGLVGMPLYASYCASKFAVEGLCEALRFEAQLHNVQISNVEPGSYDTGFAKRSVEFGKRTRSPASPYKKLNDYFFERTGNTRFSDPKEVADLIVRIVEKKRARFWNPIGSKVKPLFIFKRYLGIELTQAIMRRLMKVPR